VKEAKKSKRSEQDAQSNHCPYPSMRFLSIAETNYSLGVYFVSLAVLEFELDLIGCNGQPVSPVIGLDFGLKRAALIPYVLKTISLTVSAYCNA
jgi:hypothetical protein